MSGFSFKNDVFEGPLDLMLMLIAKHKLDIRDIEISVLLTQFLLYLEEAQNADIEIAGEFLEAAARLIFIKTATLLPKHEVEQLKKELEGALIEYALCKAMAERLRKSFIGYDIFVREAMQLLPDNRYNVRHDAAELAVALGAVLNRAKLVGEPPPPVTESLNITYISVFTKIVYVLRKMKTAERLDLKPLFADVSRSDKVALFLALLELTNNGRIRFSEDLDCIMLNTVKEERA